MLLMVDVLVLFDRLLTTSSSVSRVTVAVTSICDQEIEATG